MSKIEDLPDKVKSDFCALIDEAILESTDDKDMKEGFVTLDKIARKMRITFYDLMLQIFEYEEIINKVDAWNKEKDIKDDTSK